MCGLRTGREGERILLVMWGLGGGCCFASYSSSLITRYLSPVFRALFPDPQHLQQALDQNLAPLRYVDDTNNITQVTN